MTHTQPNSPLRATPRRATRRPRFGPWLGAGAGLLAAVPAGAQVMAEPAAPTIGPEAFAAMDALGAPLLELRENAELEVLETLLAESNGDPARTEVLLEAFEDWLAGSVGSMGPEARARAERLAVALYSRLPYAGMGMAPSELPNGSIRISTVVNGFHVARVLRVGDVVRRLGGVRLRGDEHMRTLIVSYRPGDRIDVEFVRDGESVRGTVTLGSFASLTNARPLDRSLLRNAWRERFRRRTADDQAAPSAPIGAEHGPEVWLGAIDPSTPRPRTDINGRVRPRLNPRTAGSDAPFVVHTRPGIETETAPQRFFRLGALNWRDEIEAAPTGFRPVVETELAQLRAMVAAFDAQIADIEAELAGAEAGDAVLAELTVRLDEVRQERVRMGQRIERLRAQLGTADEPGTARGP